MEEKGELPNENLRELWHGSFEELEAWLREFVNFLGDPCPYDEVGVFVLFQALLDNLRKDVSDGLLEEELAGMLSNEQAAFLRRLLELRGGGDEPTPAP